MSNDGQDGGGGKKNKGGGNQAKGGVSLAANVDSASMAVSASGFRKMLADHATNSLGFLFACFAMYPMRGILYRAFGVKEEAPTGVPGGGSGAPAAFTKPKQVLGPLWGLAKQGAVTDADVEGIVASLNSMKEQGLIKSAEGPVIDAVPAPAPTPQQSTDQAEDADDSDSDDDDGDSKEDGDS